jgi:formyltetrahydrofolate synthetase
LLEATNPRNAIEFIYIRKAADLTFQINRYERDRDGLLVAEQIRILKTYLQDKKIKPSIEAALLQWSMGEETATEIAEKVLEEQGLNSQHLYSRALQNKLDALQKIEAIINSLENRRFSLFREIDRHRDALGKQLQEAIRQQDGSYSIKFSQDDEPLTAVGSAAYPGSK